jgi:hypothetical protein
MRQRTFGTTDLRASEVGLAVSAMAAGRDDEAAAGLLRRALDLGVTFFEAADVDPEEGRGERLLAEAVRGHRDEVTVAAAFGYDTAWSWERPGRRDPRHDWSVAYAGRALDRTLRRLRTEPPPDRLAGDTDALQVALDGLSVLDGPELRAALAPSPPSGRLGRRAHWDEREDAAWSVPGGHHASTGYSGPTEGGVGGGGDSG